MGGSVSESTSETFLRRKKVSHVLPFPLFTSYIFSTIDSNYSLVEILAIIIHL